MVFVLRISMLVKSEAFGARSVPVTANFSIEESFPRYKGQDTLEAIKILLICIMFNVFI